EAVVQQRPRRVLARRSAAEVVARDQDPGAAGLGAVEHEVGLLLPVGAEAPVAEQVLAQAVLAGGLEEAGRDDLVGVDVLDRQHDGARAEGLDRCDFHQSISRASVILPVTAAAAAVSGLARNVRPPAPCRPSKLRLLVLTEY